MTNQKKIIRKAKALCKAIAKARQYVEAVKGGMSMQEAQRKFK